MSTIPRIVNSETAAEYGAICTFENAEGGRINGHRKGKPTEALRELCEAAQALDPSYRVICYSTPQTVYADVVGRKSLAKAGKPHRKACIEAQRLTAIGMRHMLHPRLAPQWERGSAAARTAREFDL